MNQQTAYADDAVVAQMTRLLVDAGHEILQSHRLGPTDRAHVRALLTLFDPPAGAHVLDIGAGVGAVAAHMTAIRPDLRFTLLNLSPAQLAMAGPSDDNPADYSGTLRQPARVAADMHDLPFPDATFDAAMFNFSLGHGDLDIAMPQARRVVRPGGILFLYELTTEQPDDILPLMGYRPHRADEVLISACVAGLKVTSVSCPLASTADAERMFGSAWTDRGFDRCWPIACRFHVT